MNTFWNLVVSGKISVVSFARTSFYLKLLVFNFSLLMDCICHYSQIINETLLRLDNDQLNRVRDFAQKWLEVGKEPKLGLSKKIVQLDLQEDNSESLYYHSCYLRFASSSKLDRAKSSLNRLKVGSRQSQLIGPIN